MAGGRAREWTAGVVGQGDLGRKMISFSTPGSLEGFRSTRFTCRQGGARSRRKSAISLGKANMKSIVAWMSIAVSIGLSACGLDDDGSGGNVGASKGDEIAASLASFASCSTPAGAQIGSFVDPDTASPISPPNPPGITLKDTSGNLVNAHGGGIIKVCDTFYLHGEYFSSTSSDNNFRGFAMYSSKNLSIWKYEAMILSQQSSGLLGPNRKGERPHIIQCPATGEFVLYAHAADVTYQADKEVVYATSSTVNGTYSFKGALKNTSGTQISHSDMSALGLTRFGGHPPSDERA